MILSQAGTGLVGAHLLLHLLQTDARSKPFIKKNSNLRGMEEVFRFIIPTQSQELFQKISWVEADINDLLPLKIAFENVGPIGLSLCCL